MSRIFDPGSLTFCSSGHGSIPIIYIGTLQLGYVKEFKVKYLNNEMKIFISFISSDDPDLKLKIEENVRLAKSLKWIEVK